ncbi:hypothetical protein HPP92_017808 [Vanilla planifolia]|uniref:Uncharacterized protein n=1 Tax=Vanilla planifolia TaxID=51239 RepID=A0A835QD38_VANPL|nr:hypothetical protein HPP92_017808 [Vanilla planifolia]
MGGDESQKRKLSPLRLPYRDPFVPGASIAFEFLFLVRHFSLFQRIKGVRSSGTPFLFVDFTFLDSTSFDFAFPSGLAEREFGCKASLRRYYNVKERKLEIRIGEDELEKGGVGKGKSQDGASESIPSKLQQQATPLLTFPLPSESSLADILVKKSSSSSNSISGTLNPNVLLELFSMYREWQEEKTLKISQQQEEIENKIETADALASKLLQRYNFTVSSMKTTAHNLAKVHQLQVEVGKLKGRLTEVISNCDALCKRIVDEGPESLRTSNMPFSATAGLSGPPTS